MKPELNNGRWFIWLLNGKFDDTTRVSMSTTRHRVKADTEPKYKHSNKILLHPVHKKGVRLSLYLLIFEPYSAIMDKNLLLLQ